jgi:hypothetical protein
LANGEWRLSNATKRRSDEKSEPQAPALYAKRQGSTRATLQNLNSARLQNQNRDRQEADQRAADACPLREVSRVSRRERSPEKKNLTTKIPRTPRRIKKLIGAARRKPANT